MYMGSEYVTDTTSLRNFAEPSILNQMNIIEIFEGTSNFGNCEQHGDGNLRGDHDYHVNFKRGKPWQQECLALNFDF